MTIDELHTLYAQTIEKQGIPPYVVPVVASVVTLFVLLKLVKAVSRMKKAKKEEQEREKFLRGVADRRRRHAEAIDPSDRKQGGVFSTPVELSDAEKDLRAKILRDTMGRGPEDFNSQIGLPESEKKLVEASQRKVSELVKKAEITCGEGQNAYKVVLTAKSLSVFEEASRNPGVVGKTGEEFVRAIAATGGILEVERYKGDKLNDTADGEPAFQSFNDEGVLVGITRYRDGKRNDSPTGEPAHQSFNRDGRLVRVTRYKDDKLDDSASGEPAFQSFDDEGHLVWVIRYRDDRQLKVLSATEIAEYLESLNIAKGIENAIPGLKIH